MGGRSRSLGLDPFESCDSEVRGAFTQPIIASSRSEYPRSASATTRTHKTPRSQTAASLKSSKAVKCESDRTSGLTRSSTQLISRSDTIGIALRVTEQNPAKNRKAQTFVITVPKEH